MIGLDISHLNISENGPTKSDFFCKMLEIKNADRPKMKMANPRKFSEKIALHKQRQAEEQASYERVLMEVRAVTQTPVQVF